MSGSEYFIIPKGKEGEFFTLLKALRLIAKPYTNQLVRSPLGLRIGAYQPHNDDGEDMHTDAEREEFGRQIQAAGFQQVEWDEI